MKCSGTLWYLCICFLALFLPASLPAQTDCEQGDGELNSAQPQGKTAEEIIQKFAAREAVFKEARNHYTYTQEVTVQTLDGNSVDGELRETTDILYDDHGRRLEQVKFAPQST